jgi:acyl transferase domain-containing protein
MDCGAEAVFTANQAVFSLLGQLGIRPDVVLGHSTGESSALVGSGAIQIQNDDRLIQGVLEHNALYEEMIAEKQIPEGVLLTVGGIDRKNVLSVIEESDGLYLAMDNCPHQVVLYGSDRVIERTSERLRNQGAICTRLPFSRAYHTPLFQPFCDRMSKFFAGLEIVPPKVEMYSCITARPYPQDVAEIRRLASEQWMQPVRFRETIESIYDAGVRIFVEVGPRHNLTAFVDDILRGHPYLAIPSDIPHRPGIIQLNHLVGLLGARRANAVGCPTRDEHRSACPLRKDARP